MFGARAAIISVTLLCLGGNLFVGCQARRRCPFAQLQEEYPESASAHHTAPATVAIAESSIPNPGRQLYALGSEHAKSNAISGVDVYALPHGGTSPNYSFQNVFAQKAPERLQCGIPPASCAADPTNLRYRTMDGSCNNLLNPGLGMAIGRYARILPPKYGDGVYTPTASVTGAPLPNARLISLSVYGDETQPDDFRTVAALQWGQLVAHDISRQSTKDAPDDCCNDVRNPQCYPIALHPQGPIAGHSAKKCISFARSISDADAICPNSGLPYAEKLTVSTPYLDLSTVYGNSLKQSSKVRAYTGGLLRTSIYNNRHFLPVAKSEDGECAKDSFQCYSIPDGRNQLVPTSSALNTIVVREHNRIARALAQLNPHYTDERIYQEARKLNIAQYQKITYYDWLPLVLGRKFALANRLIYNIAENDYVNDYNPSVDPAAYASFAAGAFRYSHTQIPGWFSLVSPNRDYNQTMRLSDYFERPENLDFIAYGNNFDSMIRGMATQLHKRPDGNIDKEIKHYFNRKTMEQFGDDLKAMDIQRSRDFGLPSYNDFREICGLPRATDWSGFSRELTPKHIHLLQQLYEVPDDVELAVGGSLEAHTKDSTLGPTFKCITSRQFLKARLSDRFFFEREDPHSGFTRAQLAEIRKASLSGLFCNNADSLRLIQPNSFVFPNTRNILVDCKSLPQIDLSLWQEVPLNSGY